MSTRVIVETHVKPEAHAELTSRFEETLVETRKYDGCIEISVYVNQDDPNHFVFLSRWDSREHYERYIEEGRKAGAVEEYEAALSKPLSIQYFDDLGH